MDATKEQKKAIRANFGYDINLKEEAVQWATGDNSKTSLNDLSFEQAARIIAKQTGRPEAPTENWALFDRMNSRHMLILSLLRTAQWTTTLPNKGVVADLDRFSDFLKSKKSPINKPLLKMTDAEIEKVITALSGIVGSTYKTKKS